MTSVQSVLDAAQQLSPVEQLEIIQQLSHSLQKHYHSRPEEGLGPIPSPVRRIPSLDAGSVWMSDDFDAELPDAFWLGSSDEYDSRH
jgi:hypothetical protein